MSAVRGCTLGRVLTGSMWASMWAPLPKPLVLHVALQLSDALEYLHEMCVVHWDLHMNNIMLDVDC